MGKVIAVIDGWFLPSGEEMEIPPNASIEMATPMKKRLNASIHDGYIWMVQAASLDLLPSCAVAAGGFVQPLSTSGPAASTQLIAGPAHLT